ncbi:hypothetical protein [Adhaeribacter soli]|uniref:Uncharacterized protein n=1 Tax=Adhaeribacter soli TaxID=2607655 RepID=A0A5N1J1M7_9BACT|nr:hypothetical protein [Adhaeribacter soli]KAA9340324.1 hypothetical protein F0P94_08235 [Adhaeribacter soli]
MEKTVKEPVKSDKAEVNNRSFTSYFNRKPFCNQFPEYGFVYFDHLQAEYENYFIGSISDVDLDHIGAIREKRKNYSLAWSDVYKYETIFLKLINESHLPRKAWDLRNRYRDIVGLKEYEAYLASRPPEIPGHFDAEELRADIGYLLDKIYLHYSLTPYNERLRNSISKKVTIMVMAGLALLISAAFLPKLALLDFSYAVPPILIVIYAGAMGGLISMLQRYNNLPREGDPINSIPGLMQYWSRMFIPAINGAFFAALLYIILIGKLISGGPFPEFAESPFSNGSSISDFLLESVPDSPGSYAKLIVWSFIAGFAERFVPETLTRFVSKSEKEKEIKA